LVEPNLEDGRHNGVLQLEKSFGFSLSLHLKHTSLWIQFVKREMEPTRIIHTWSGPRSLSTALLYSFAQRPDCQVFDEPLYANYLRNFATLHRPYRHQLLESETRSSNDVLLSMIESAKEKLVFAKHIVKQCTDDIDLDLLTAPGSRHVFLIRNPLDMIMSWNQKNHVHNESQDIYGTTVMDLVALFTKIRSKTGVTPLVVDVDELVKNPEGILSNLCLKLEIPFLEEQLTWSQGPKPEIDGCFSQLAF
jgi:protein-lysine N-methyltransferase EEF2KMT